MHLLTLPNSARLDLVTNAVLYNVLVFVLFGAIYAVMDFDVHFSADHRVTFAGKMYYGVMTHTGVGCNEVAPKTDLARLVTAAHAIASWMQLFIVFLAHVAHGAPAPHA